MSSQIEYTHITPRSGRHLSSGFINVYKTVFGGHPYFETYTDDEVVDKVWLPHLVEGIMFVATHQNQVVGLSCAIPILEAPPEDRDFIKASYVQGSLIGSLETTWYMSELAVLNEYRRQGIGLQLIDERLKLILARGGERYIFRTAAVGSMSEPLYRKIGAVQLPGIIDVSQTDQVRVNASKSHERKCFYGHCATAIDTIDKIRNLPPAA